MEPFLWAHPYWIRSVAFQEGFPLVRGRNRYIYVKIYIVKWPFQRGWPHHGGLSKGFHLTYIDYSYIIHMINNFPFKTNRNDFTMLNNMCIKQIFYIRTVFCSGCVFMRSFFYVFSPLMLWLWDKLQKFPIEITFQYPCSDIKCIHSRFKICLDVKRIKRWYWTDTKSDFLWESLYNPRILLILCQRTFKCVCNKST